MPLGSSTSGSLYCPAYRRINIHHIAFISRQGSFMWSGNLCLVCGIRRVLLCYFLLVAARSRTAECLLKRRKSVASRVALQLMCMSVLHLAVTKSIDFSLAFHLGAFHLILFPVIPERPVDALSPIIPPLGYATPLSETVLCLL